MTRILITGDFAPRTQAMEYIRKGEYSVLLDEVKHLTAQADIAVTNLETPLVSGGNPIPKTGPNIKADPSAADALVFAGFNMATLANNHIMDFGWEGLDSTIRTCRQKGIEVMGAGKNLDEAKRIKYATCKNKRIAFINIAENEWSTTKGNEPGANPLDEIHNYHQIQEAKKNADHVIVIIHGGHETYGLPSPRMKNLYRWFVDIGADAVIGHHTHCFSGDEIYSDKPIVYSLGNFFFDQKGVENTPWNEGAMAEILISDDSVKLNLIPFIQNSGTIGIHILTNRETENFEALRQEKAAIIADDTRLTEEFNKFISKKRNLYSAYLEPFKNRLLIALINRKIIPSPLSKSYRRLLLNIIRTESHRDIILHLLKHLQ